MNLFDRATGVAPAERLAVVRVAVFGFGAAYLLIRFGSLMAVNDLAERRFSPVGPVRLLDAPLPDAILLLAIVTTVVACALASVGWRWRWSSVGAAAGLTFVLSYRLSWGPVLHTENLLVAHAAILAFTPAADAWSSDARGRQSPAESWRYGWALQTLALATALGYGIAAWAKIRNGGIDWITGDVLRNHIASDNLRKELLGDISSPFTSLTTPRAWLFPPLAAASMVIELGAFIALARGRIRRLWVPVTWLFHVSILGLMAILFPYQLLGVAFLPFVEGEKLVRRSLRAFRRRHEELRR